MQLLNPDVERYLAQLALTTDPVLAEMERLASERSFPIVGPQVGRLLFVMASSIQARRVLELGSGFGYSAQWFARAVGPEGEVLLTEYSEERAAEAARFLGQSGLGDRVRIEVGDGLEIAAKLEGQFDVVFNDVDKNDYPMAFEIAVARVRIGGLFISDNMLWQGKVLEREPAEASTRGVLELTRRLHADERWASTLVPLRDGVTVSVRLR